MGRRSINSTKSGKFMNPTDRARKEARRKELKRNKRQRMAVRHAVLKNKDPIEIIKELDKIDKMEFNVDAPAPLSQKVLMDKRKKLRETFERVLKLYEKEDPEYWAEMRRAESEYEKKRTCLITYYESVKHAQEVTVDDIPLPQNMLPETATAQIPLPPGLDDLPEAPVSGILKKSAPIENSEIMTAETSLRGPPGVPPGLPPELELPGDDDAALKASASKEMTADGDTALNTAVLSNPSSSSVAKQDGVVSISGVQLLVGRPPPLGAPMQSHLTAIRLPPGPPPGLPPRLRLPPGPPPGLPPRMMGPPLHNPKGRDPTLLQSRTNVLSAGPQLKDTRQSATIEAKPQIRQINTDITRFVPSSLRVKRGGEKKTADNKANSDREAMLKSTLGVQPKPTKDDAYAVFMSEMKDLL